MLTGDSQAGTRALERLRTSLRGIECGPIRHVPVAGQSLLWFGCKPSDNLHIYRDGVVVGKVSFEEETRRSAYCHSKSLPVTLHPLLTSVTIRTSRDDIAVEPNAITNVFYCGDVVSDMQLLIADHEGLLPSAAGVALLCTAGFLPGNMTLFDRVQRIPLLYAYYICAGELRRIGSFAPRPNDDDALIDRLVSIAPRNVRSYLGLSGGYDSRFVLGCLLRAGVRPTLMHITGRETPHVREVAEQTGLEVQTCSPDTPRLHSYLYTVMTDGQMYVRGGHYSKLRTVLDQDSIYHFGLYSLPVLKNACRTAQKVPGLPGRFYERLVDYGMLSGVPREIEVLKQYNRREEISRYLCDTLAYVRDYCRLASAKELACWFEYAADHPRWMHAHTADLSFYTYPVFLLSDIEALSLGISSSAWSNFRFDRLRSMNHALLPDLHEAYYDGTSAEPRGGPLDPARKLYFEYVRRGIKAWRHQRPVRNASALRDDQTLCDSLSDSAAAFREYFTHDLDQVLAAGVRRSVQRGAVTVHHVLRYLQHDV